MDKKDILTMLIKHYAGGNKSRFASMLGITPQAISAWESRNTFDIELIFTKCENINAKWLLTGEGEMLNKEERTSEQPSELPVPQPTGTPKPYIQEHPEVLKVSDCPAPPLTERLLDIIQQQAEEIGRIRQKLEQYEQSNSK